MTIPDITLSDKGTIPQIGLGLWQVKDEAEFDTAFEAGLAAGYRHFDSAQAYHNEQFLGAAIKRSGLKRDELFLTTKIAVEHFGYHKAPKTFADSLTKLQTDHVDLLLLHFPVPILRKKSWLALEEIKAAGGAKHIGVSNYTIKHLEEMKDYAHEMPVINQVELHVFLQQPELIEYCRQHNIIYFSGQLKADAVGAYGHIPHAINIDSADFYDPVTNRLRPKAELAAIAARIPATGPVVNYCNTGHWSSTDWFVLSELLGRKNATLYYGSMVDWASSTSRPVTSSRTKWDDIKKFFGHGT